MSSSTVIVSGLPADVSQEALTDYFSRVGPVASVEMLADGQARLTMERAEDTVQALDLNGVEYREGVQLNVAAATEDDHNDDKAEQGSQPGEQTRRAPFEEGKSVLLRNLPQPMRDEEKLRAIFGPCGEITEVFIDPRRRNVFVSFATTEAAAAAVAKTGEAVEEGTLEVILRRTEASKRNDVRLVVKNLPVAVTEEQVRALFSTAGTLTDFFLKADKQLCFISYATKEEGDNAMALQGREIGENRVEVERREQSKCFNCGREGHLSAQCRSRPSGAGAGGHGHGGGSSSSIICHNCGKAGHKARECRQPSNGGGRRGPPPPRRDLADRRDDFRGGGAVHRGRDDFRDRRRRRSDSFDRPARRRSRSPASYRRRSPPSRSRSPVRQRRRYSRSRSPPRRRY